jgi:hypothetical protein
MWREGGPSLSCCEIEGIRDMLCSTQNQQLAGPVVRPKNGSGMVSGPSPRQQSVSSAKCWGEMGQRLLSPPQVSFLSNALVRSVRMQGECLWVHHSSHDTEGGRARRPRVVAPLGRKVVRCS